MEQFLFYQLKVALLAAVLVLLYKVFLGKQTFHRFNRIMLLLIAVVSVTLPLLRIKAFQTNLAILPKTTTEISKPQVIETPILATDIEQSHEEPVVSEIETPVVAMDQLTEPAPSRRNIPLLPACLIIAYGIGLLWFVIGYFRSLASVRHLIDEGRYADRREGCDVIESEGVSQPMNWMRYIVMPHRWLESKDQSMVWQHEYLHASKFHSLDLLLADLLWAMQWFNPAMKLLHGEFELIHEYEADQAVLDHGTDATQYKLMLVGAVASAKGIKMGNWLRQTKLKNRIDMMDRKKSSSWNMHKALFIPVISAAFLFANAQDTHAQAQEFQWHGFEDGKVWIFENGTAKVRTFDRAESSMKVSQVAEYLKNHEGCKTTRMTLMYMYPIEGLAQVQPLAEELFKAGIRINVANNEEMLDNMTQPEFRLVRIYGPESNGQYRFEMICNTHAERVSQRFNKEPHKYCDLSVSGDVKLMLKWIDMFDGVALAVYPSKKMPLADLQKFADAAWKRGIDQVSVVDAETEFITLIPQGMELAKEYGKLSVLETVRKINSDLATVEGGEYIIGPRSSNNTNEKIYHVESVIRTKDKTVLVFHATQGADLWIENVDNLVIKSGGKEYRLYDSDGLKGFEQKYFWSPDWGKYTLVGYFPALPENARTVDLYDNDGSLIIRNLQVSNSVPDIFYNQFVNVEVDRRHYLKTMPMYGPNGGWDNFSVESIEFSDTETTLFCKMALCQAKSFPGFVGDDFIITLNDGTKITPVRIEGVPVGKEFARSGDFAANYFQIVFPKISIELFQADNNNIVLTGSICHEPVEVKLICRWAAKMKALRPFKPGEYTARIFEIDKDEEGDIYVTMKAHKIDRFIVEENGTITIKGDPTRHMPDGSYTMEVKVKNELNSEVKLKCAGKSFLFQAYGMYIGNHIDQAELAPSLEDGTRNIEWNLIVTPVQ